MKKIKTTVEDLIDHSDIFIHPVCDDCSDNAGYIRKDKINKLIESGWSVIDDNTYCPECAKKQTHDTGR